MAKSWAEEYRPKNLDDYIFQDANQKKTFEKYIAEQEFPHLLLSGIQGSGKTTMSLILTNALELDSSDILKINCSDKMIEAIRDEVKSFVSLYAFGKYKIVRLEEFDYMSQNGQGALRAIMDECGDTVRFIATCNYENKIMPAIKSRFTSVVFKTPDRQQVIMRVGEILALEDIDFDMDTLEKFVQIGYPDIRKTINLVQANSGTGKLIVPTSDSFIDDYKFDLLDQLEAKDFIGLQKNVSANVAKEELEGIYTFLQENIHRAFKVQKDEFQAVLKIAEYAYKNSMMADQELNFRALCIELYLIVGQL